MEAAIAFEVPAAETRERLAEFVEEVVAGLPHIRQRENALLYVRGLIEHGGRKSLQPTLFRLEETPARYESMQQFLADSPWEPELLVRACAERVAPELGVAAWVVDDTGIAKDGQAFAGGEAPVLGHARQDRQLPDHRLACTRSASGGRCRWAGRCICPRSGAPTASDGGGRRCPSEVVFRDEAAARRGAGRAGRRLGAAGGADPGRLRLRRRQRLPHAACTRSSVSTCSPSRRRISVYGPETTFAVPERNGSVGRPRDRSRRPDRRARVGACARRAAARARLEDAALPHHPGGRGRLRPLRLRPCRRHASGPQRPSAAARGVADHRVARQAKRRRATTGSPTCPRTPSRERLARLARLRWTIELDYRQLKGELGLDHYEGRSYLGFHHHCALVTCAHAFLTLERLDPKAPRPA